jgi:hypothetical protein
LVYGVGYVFERQDLTLAIDRSVSESFLVDKG